MRPRPDSTDADSPDDALLDAHATVAALGLVPDVKEYLDAVATKLAKQWLTDHRVAIKALTGERQDTYGQLREMSTEPQDLDLAKPNAWLVPTTERHGDTETPLPRYRMHLLANEDGTFPADRNAWEAEVLDREHDRDGFVGWYRNPSRSSQDSLAVAYEHGGRVRTLRPDFVFFQEDTDGSIAASIVDPHGHHLGDALPKLRGLAAYAERHGHHYNLALSRSRGGTARTLNLAELGDWTARQARLLGDRFDRLRVDAHQVADELEVADRHDRIDELIDAALGRGPAPARSRALRAVAAGRGYDETCLEHTHALDDSTEAANNSLRLLLPGQTRTSVQSGSDHLAPGSRRHWA